MATYYTSITDEQAALIHNAPLFFVASVDPNLTKGPGNVGPVNLSPKGGVKLHIVNRSSVAYLDYPGSGNETARHAATNGPVTIMVCSFDEDDAAIIRLFGKATVTPFAESPLADVLAQQSTSELKAPRQVIEIEIEQTMTSCGYGVPVMSLVRERQRDDRGRKYKEAQ
ncbi:MAG TPA: pyridoxamine 5'-phosphate oxidase family protein [Anaerolineae bacterium]|nr:pyridoxamine 5'-phosphate oxidase family protein [Anaerolineae bacterium]